MRRFGPYIPTAQRLHDAAREMARLNELTGESASPVTLESRTIAATYWGKAWCANLELYSDFATRLPRGRRYVRNGSVVDLRIEPGRIQARVAGSELYAIGITIKRLAAARWAALKRACTGRIASLVGLLRGELSAEVLAVLTRPQTGLFPEPAEISMRCSCPDHAALCKHLAATLYGVGARLDSRPELFFVLRQVEQAELISAAIDGSAGAPGKRATTGKRISSDKLAAVFGIELEAPTRRGRRLRAR